MLKVFFSKEAGNLYFKANNKSVLAVNGCLVPNIDLQNLQVKLVNKLITVVDKNEQYIQNFPDFKVVIFSKFENTCSVRERQPYSLTTEQLYVLWKILKEEYSYDMAIENCMQIDNEYFENFFK